MSTLRPPDDTFIEGFDVALPSGEVVRCADRESAKAVERLVRDEQMWKAAAGRSRSDFSYIEAGMRAITAQFFELRKRVGIPDGVDSSKWLKENL